MKKESDLNEERARTLVSNQVPLENLLLSRRGQSSEVKPPKFLKEKSREGEARG